jgi:alpha-D-ribose 1-methylphosphonate 5-triphosphate synthase subunit PhnH
MQLIVRDLRLHAGKKQLPVCAFSLRNGQIYTGNWEPLNPACTVLVVTLIDKEAPPIYLSVEAIDAVAVNGAA